MQGEHHEWDEDTCTAYIVGPQVLVVSAPDRAGLLGASGGMLFAGYGENLTYSGATGCPFVGSGPASYDTGLLPVVIPGISVTP